MKRRSYSSQRQAKKATDAAKSAAIWSLIGATLAGCQTAVPVAVQTPCVCEKTPIPSELAEPKKIDALDNLKTILDEIN